MIFRVPCSARRITTPVRERAHRLAVVARCKEGSPLPPERCYFRSPGEATKLRGHYGFQFIARNLAVDRSALGKTALVAFFGCG